MVSSDKRRSPRYKPKAGTHILYVEGSAAIKDLSEHGMYVLDAEPLSEGSKVKFTFRLGAVDIPMEGIVTRSVEGHGMVIEFTEISREAKRRLRIHLAELGPSS